MRLLLGATGFLLLAGCATADRRAGPGLEMAGLPGMIRPQVAPSVMSFESPRYRRYKTAPQNSVVSAGQRSIRVLVGNQWVVLPTRGYGSNFPVASNSEMARIPEFNMNQAAEVLDNKVIIQPVIQSREIATRPTAYGGSQANPYMTKNEVVIQEPTVFLPLSSLVLSARTEDGSLPRNPSFKARRPVMATRAPYQILSAGDLLRKVELSPRFQPSTADWADPIDRWLDNSAAILKANPRTMVKITGYALNNEIGGRALAEMRAGTVANALIMRGVGSSRIETEGRLVLLGRATPSAQAEVARASRRAQIKVVYGSLGVDPFRPGLLP